MPTPSRMDNGKPRLAKPHASGVFGVGDGDRTRNLLDHNQALYQTSSAHHRMVTGISRRGELGMGLSQHGCEPGSGEDTQAGSEVKPPPAFPEPDEGSATPLAPHGDGCRNPRPRPAGTLEGRTLEMPNHVTNRLHIKGTVVQVDLVRETLEGAVEPDNSNAPRPVDFEKIVPMPDSLQVKSGIEARVAQSPDEWEGHAERPGFDQKVYKRCLENIRLHGHPTWYEWCRANWGTKWNAYQQHVVDHNILEFQTAWNMPYQFMQMLAARFPDVEFVVEFADEDIGSNCGTATYRGGVLVSLEEPGDPTKFAYRIKGYSDEEIAEREREIAEDA